MSDSNNSTRFEENLRGRRRPTLARMQSLMRRPLSSYAPNEFEEMVATPNSPSEPSTLAGSIEASDTRDHLGEMQFNLVLGKCLKFVVIKLDEVPDLLAKGIVSFLRSSFTPH